MLIDDELSSAIGYSYNIRLKVNFSEWVAPSQAAETKDMTNTPQAICGRRIGCAIRSACNNSHNNSGDEVTFLVRSLQQRAIRCRTLLLASSATDVTGVVISPLPINKSQIEIINSIFFRTCGQIIDNIRLARTRIELSMPTGGGYSGLSTAEWIRSKKN